MAIPSNDAGMSSELKFELEFARRMCEANGSPYAAGQFIHLKYGGLGPAAAPIKPSDYLDPTRFAEDYQVAEMLKKSMHLPGFTEETRIAAARENFNISEVCNASTNYRLWVNSQPDWFSEFSYQVMQILGPLNTEALNQIELDGGFGPGACIGVRTEGLVPSQKYEAKPACTPLLSSLLPGLIPEGVASIILDDTPALVNGNAFFTVPKSFKIKRCAAKEPLWNTYIQHGIGEFLRKRLLRFGVDLKDQTRNQILAGRAYDEGLATIDLTSASDRMTRVLLKLALLYNGDPQGARWHHLLNLARSHHMKDEGVWRALEMFSSMGNGFTFPLESVIFLAVVRSVVSKPELAVCAVYGDDIIVPQRHAPSVIERLEYLGFEVNRSKTCLAGVFFESCGHDYFKGRNVRPFYLTHDGSQIPYALQAANALRAWCLRVFGCLPRKYYSVWAWCKSGIPVSWRYPVPTSLGDSGLNTSLSEAIRLGVKPAGETHEWFEGYRVRHTKLVPIHRDRKSWGVLYAGLTRLGVLDSASHGLEPMRGIFGRPRTEWLIVHWWDDVNWE